MIQILELVNTCSSPTLSYSIDIVKRLLSVVQIAGPILLLIALTIHFFKLMLNPEDKEQSKKIKNSVIATVVLFMIPTFINASMRILNSSFTISACWNSKTELSGSTDYVEEDDERKPVIRPGDSEFEQGEPDDTGTTTSTTTTSTTSTGEILPTTGSGKYFPALQGSNFKISGPSETGGCKDSGKVKHDLNIHENTKVYAAFDGTIEFNQYVCNGVLYSYGNQARLTDSKTGTYVIYCHFSKFEGVTAPVTKTCHKEYGKNAKCGAGDCKSGSVQKKTILKKQVKKGELIGYTGNTGNSEGPHLHVEIHENGSSKCLTDPYSAMGMH